MAVNSKAVAFELSKNSIHADNDSISVKLIIKGRVQGVYYRVNMQKVAKENSVFGWVRNLSDGNVEALLEGYQANVNHVVQWSKIGPENAKVDDVIVDFKEYTGKYGDFLIQHDEA